MKLRVSCLVLLSCSLAVQAELTELRGMSIKLDNELPQHLVVVPWRFAEPLHMDRPVSLIERFPVAHPCESEALDSELRAQLKCSQDTSELSAQAGVKGSSR